MSQSNQAPRASFLTTLAVFLFVCALLYGLFLWVRGIGLNRDIGRLEADMTRFESEIAILKENDVETLSYAAELTDLLEIRELKWSEFLDELNTLASEDIFFSSYSAGGQGDVQLSGVANSYRSVSEMIARFEASPLFDPVFVPSTTLGTRGDGSQVVSFSLDLNLITQ